MTNSPSPKQQLQDIYQLIRLNKRQEARQLLQQFLKTNPPDADAYYIATFLTDDINRKIQSCERALQINPNHGPTMQLLERLQEEQARTALSDLIASIDDETVELVKPSVPPPPEPTAEPVRQAEPAAPAPFVDTWVEEKSKVSNSGKSAPINSALLFIGGLVLGILVVSTIAVWAISRINSQPTPAPIMLVVTATEPAILPTNRPTETSTPQPPTRTRRPTFTPIPTRTSGSVFNLTPGTNIPPTSRVDNTRIPNKVSTPTPTRQPTSTPLPPLGASTLDNPVNMLSFNVLDAEYNTSLDKIIFVADAPNALYIFDPETQMQQTILLSRPPTCLSISQDGNFAAVGHDALISYIDLRTAQVVKTLDVSATATDIVLLNSGWVAVMPFYAQHDAVRMVSIDTNTEVREARNVYGSGYLVRALDGNSFYYGTRGLSPEHIKHFYFDGTKLESQDWSYHGDHDFCESFWVSEVGSRIYGRCGEIFRTSAESTQDMTYAGTLPDVTLLEGVVPLTAQNKLLVMARPDQNNTNSGSQAKVGPLMLITYNSDSLLRENAFVLPSFADGRPADSGYLFMNAARTHYYALLANNVQLHSRKRATDKGGAAQFGIVVGDVMANTITSATAVPAVAVSVGSQEIGKAVPISYEVARAAYSKSLKQIVMISPNQAVLHLYDPVNNSETSIELPRLPTALDLSADGTFAAVGHEALVSYVDLQAGKVLNSYEVAGSIYAVMLANNGWVYISGTKLAISIELATGLQSKGIQGTPKLHPSGLVYSVIDGHLVRYSLADPVIPKAVMTSNWNSMKSSGYCGLGWFGEDGQRMFTQCADILRNSADEKQDLVSNGTLERLIRLQSLAHSQVSGKMLAIGTSNDPSASFDNKVIVYDYETLATDKIIQLPALTINGIDHRIQGQNVFFDPDGNQFYVVLKTKEKDNAPSSYGIVRMQISDDTASNIGTSATTLPASVPADIAVLDFAVSQAAYSQPMERIIMITLNPLQMVIYNPTDKTELRIPLPERPNNLDLAPDGLYAVVTSDASVMLVDLSAAQVLKTYKIDDLSGSPIVDAAMAMNGFIYALSRKNVYAVNVKTGDVQTYESSVMTYPETVSILPNGQALYFTNKDISPTSIYRMTISSEGSLSKAVKWPYHGDYYSCDKAWPAEDNTRLYNGCGTLFKTDAASQQDLTYNGQLGEQRARYRWIADSAVAQVVLGLVDIEWIKKYTVNASDPNFADPMRNVFVFDRDTLQQLTAVPLPQFPAPNQQVKSRGLYVFINTASDQIYVILQAEPEAGLLNDYGVWSSPLPKKAS